MTVNLPRNTVDFDKFALNFQFEFCRQFERKDWVRAGSLLPFLSRISQLLKNVRFPTVLCYGKVRKVA
jgi:hypothetical protein